jgi:hypothetical protein
MTGLLGVIVDAGFDRGFRKKIFDLSSGDAMSLPRRFLFSFRGCLRPVETMIRKMISSEEKFDGIWKLCGRILSACNLIPSAGKLQESNVPQSGRKKYIADSHSCQAQQATQRSN